MWLTVILHDCVEKTLYWLIVNFNRDHIKRHERLGWDFLKSFVDLEFIIKFVFHAFSQVEDGFKPEEIYIDEGLQNCSRFEDVCFGQLSISTFNFSTNQNENASAVRLNLIKGCKSLENSIVGSSWPQNQSCFVSNVSNESSHDSNNSNQSNFESNISNRSDFLTSHQSNIQNESASTLHSDFKDDLTNHLNHFSFDNNATEHTILGITFNLTELRSSFKLNGFIKEIVDLVSQSETCFCHGDLCNSGSSRCNHSLFTVLAFALFVAIKQYLRIGWWGMKAYLLLLFTIYAPFNAGDKLFNT